MLAAVVRCLLFAIHETLKPGNYAMSAGLAPREWETHVCFV